MRVIATAGHVDHGKSTLVRALTGMEPDRWAEERRRGMTIDLGFAWTTLPSGEQLAFVDVPGHERFMTNMLAGVGPVPAVLLVIAADEGWAAQTEEHVRALDALGVRHGLVAVTRSDLADPAPAIEQAREQLAGTSLRGIPAVSVSGETRAGLNDLRAALDALAQHLPDSDPIARVRLWVDRSFTIRGSGTVVTGTLGSGTLRRGGTLELGGELVSVRGLQRLGEPADEVPGPARVAVNLRGISHASVHRGDALLTPGAWLRTDVADARIDSAEISSHLMLHVGAAGVPVHVRRMGFGQSDGSTLVRLTLGVPLPLQVGDRVLLRDPGRRQILAGATVLDPGPPSLHRRGAARERAAVLGFARGVPSLGAELKRRGAASIALLRALGVSVPETPPSDVVVAGQWLVAESQWQTWRRELLAVVDQRRPGLVDAGTTRAEVVRRLRLPDAQLLSSLLRSCPDLEEVGGRVRRRGSATSLRPDVEAAIGRLHATLDTQPFSAPEHAQLGTLGLGHRELGAAAAAGAILLLPGDVALLPTAPNDAAELLRALPQPFTLSAARQALSTTRRVAVPLLEHLDRIGVTERVDGDLRRLRVKAAAGS